MLINKFMCGRVIRSKLAPYLHAPFDATIGRYLWPYHYWLDIKSSVSLLLSVHYISPGGIDQVLDCILLLLLLLSVQDEEWLRCTVPRLPLRPGTEEYFAEE